MHVCIYLFAADNLKSCAQVPECSPYLLYGFVELKTFLSDSIHIPEIYFLLSGLLLATPVPELPNEPKVSSLERCLRCRRHSCPVYETLLPAPFTGLPTVSARGFGQVWLFSGQFQEVSLNTLQKKNLPCCIPPAPHILKSSFVHIYKL